MNYEDVIDTRLRKALNVAAKFISKYDDAIEQYKTQRNQFLVATEAEIDEIIDNIHTKTYDRNN
jgi:hypothetical protein